MPQDGVHGAADRIHALHRTQDITVAELRAVGNQRQVGFACNFCFAFGLESAFAKGGFDFSRG